MRIVGFSLFFNPTRKQWQRSIRYEGEPGWSVSHVGEDEAQQVLQGLSGAGDGKRALDRLAATLDAWRERVAR